MYLFEIYDPEDNLIFVGNTNEVCEQFNIQLNSLYAYYSRNSKIGGIYTVKRIETEKPKKAIPRTPSIEEQMMDYIIRHLNYYGNVYMKHDPSEYLDELKKLGYRCKIDKYQVIDDAEIIISESCLNNRKRKRKYATDYVLTRVKDEV